jgi:hypothetical protein
MRIASSSISANLSCRGTCMFYLECFRTSVSGSRETNYRPLTYLWSWALLEEKSNLQLLKNFPAFYGTRRFITVFTRALHWSLSWARWIQSISSYLSKIHPPTPWSSQWSLSFWLSQYPICIPRLLHSCYKPCPFHPPWLDHSNYTWRSVQAMKLLIVH